jgi:S1-C subfamily serine protease
LQDAVEQKPIDSKQVLKIIRDGTPITVEVLLKEYRESSLKRQP